MKPVAPTSPTPGLTSPQPEPQFAPVPGRALDSTVLLGAKGEVEIAHEGETYRLRRTRQGKLILTK